MRTKLLIGILLIVFSIFLIINRVEFKGYIEEKVRQFQLPRVAEIEEVDEPAETIEKEAVSDNIIIEETPVDSAKILPEEFNLAVPFTSQAPFENWSLPYKEACEEASIIMVDAFYGNKQLTKQNAKTEIDKLVLWQNEKFGYYEDTNARETARMLEEYFGYSVNVKNEPIVEDIKEAVFEGNLVLAPTAGRELGNIYFRRQGPLYHMLVIRGWTKKNQFITNDPGTRRGEGYLYDFDVLMNAIHDWNDGDVENGEKVVIIVKK